MSYSIMEDIAMPKWKADSSSNNCAICGEVFRHRKHHCRVCGELVCDDCSQNRIRCVKPIPDTPRLKRYNMAKDAVRVCDACTKDSRVLYIEDSFEGEPPYVSELFEFGRKAVTDTNAVFPVSSSRQHYQKQFDKNLHPTKESRNEHHEETHDLLREFELLRGLTTDNPMTQMEVNAAHSLKVGIANCREMAEYAYLHFHYAKMNGKIRTEEFGLYRIYGGDHCLVLTAPQGTLLPEGIFRPRDEISPHRKVVVVDPWKKSCYYFHNYVAYNGENQLEAIEGYNYRDLRRYETDYYSLEELFPKRYEPPDFEQFHDNG